MPIDPKFVLICRAPECRASFVFLPTDKHGRFEPVNAETLSEADVDAIRLSNDRPKFDRSRHVSHFATCRDPKRFRKKEKKG